MYDAIKFKINNLTQIEQSRLMKRFALFEVQKHNGKTFFHNKQNDNLKQNFRIYIKIENDVTFIELSLHKFYNLYKGLDLSNFNDFSFKNANEAFKLLADVLMLNICNSKVYFYEYGCNLEMANAPNTYMEQLKSIKTGRTNKLFTWNVYYKRFKAYSTERHSKIRTVFVLYDKSFESSQSGFLNVPKNLLRIEIKHKRIENNLTISDLQDATFQKELKSRFKRSFIDNCIFAKFPIKQKYTANQLQIYSDFENLGFAGADNKYKSQLELNTISKRTYKRRLNQLKVFAETDEKPIFVEKQTTVELKEKIRTKLSKL